MSLGGNTLERLKGEDASSSNVTAYTEEDHATYYSSSDSSSDDASSSWAKKDDLGDREDRDLHIPNLLESTRHDGSLRFPYCPEQIRFSNIS